MEKKGCKVEREVIIVVIHFTYIMPFNIQTKGMVKVITLIK
jgi:hypothetical protein